MMEREPPQLGWSEYRRLLQTDFMSFMEAAFLELNPETLFIPGAHIEMIASKLDACRTGKIKRLIINLPPRSLKSHCASICLPAWILGHDPSANLICASYGQDLADKLARDTRTLMQSDLYKALFATRIADRQAVHDFATNGKGCRMATSVGGVLTGRGADFIILDDPLKPDEALSETQRTRVNDWYDNTLLSRLNDKAKGCIIIVMQRLHQDDLVGHVEREGWETLSFPAIAAEDECHQIVSPFVQRPWRRQAGEALDPVREPLPVLAKIRAAIGEYNFLSQYQQTPMPPGGAMVKTEWLRFYKAAEKPPKFFLIAQSWDTANKAGELNDYSVCTTWGLHGRLYYLLDVFRKKLNYPELKRAVIDQHKRWGARRIIIEDKASGTQLIQDLKQMHLPVKEYKAPAGTDKLMRLHAQTGDIENGRVLLPETAPWLNEYVAELTGFPGTKHDDQVDSTTQFLDFMHLPGARPMQISDEVLRQLSVPTPRNPFNWPYGRL